MHNHGEKWMQLQFSIFTEAFWQAKVQYQQAQAKFSWGTDKAKQEGQQGNKQEVKNQKVITIVKAWQ